MSHQKEARLREFASLLSRRIDELKHGDKPVATESLKDAFRVIADTIPAITWTANSEGVVTFFNRRYYEVFGVTDADWLAIIHPDDKQVTLDAWMACVATGAPYCNAARFRDASGRYHTVQTRAQPARDANDRVSYWIGSSMILEDQAAILQVA